MMTSAGVWQVKLPASHCLPLLESRDCLALLPRSQLFETNPPSKMSKVAFVVGANGITGSYLVEHLLKHDSFAKVIATSRRPPNEAWIARDLPPNSLGNRLIWVAADLLDESVDALAAKFGGAGVGDASVLFWGAYLIGPDGWGSASETEINRKMFDNCLRATLAVNKGKLERVLLQLGEKVGSNCPSCVYCLV